MEQNCGICRGKRTKYISIFKNKIKKRISKNYLWHPCKISICCAGSVYVMCNIYSLFKGNPLKVHYRNLKTFSKNKKEHHHLSLLIFYGSVIASVFLYFYLLNIVTILMHRQCHMYSFKVAWRFFSILFTLLLLHAWIDWWEQSCSFFLKSWFVARSNLKISVKEDKLRSYKFWSLAAINSSDFNIYILIFLSSPSRKWFQDGLTGK